MFFNVENKVELMRVNERRVLPQLRHSKHHSAVIGQRVPVWANEMPGARIFAVGGRVGWERGDHVI